MIEKRTWEEFRKIGLLWWINTILHTFGWAIVLEFDGEVVVNVYPARVKFRGFSENHNTEGYISVSKYMVDNAKELEQEAQD